MSFFVGALGPVVALLDREGSARTIHDPYKILIFLRMK